VQEKISHRQRVGGVPTKCRWQRQRTKLKSRRWWRGQNGDDNNAVQPALSATVNAFSSYKTALKRCQNNTAKPESIQRIQTYPKAVHHQANVAQ